MSNANRPRTDLKPCPFDGATSRDSNGQCHCRNVLYRLVARIDDPAKKAKVSKTYNKALENGATVEDARALVAPAPAKKAAKAPAKAAAKAPVKAAAKAPVKATKAPAKKAAAKAPAKAATQSAASEPETAPETPVTDEPTEAESVALRDDTDPEWDAAAETAETTGDEPVVHEVVKGQTGIHCSCGEEGKGTLASIRAHVARANRVARGASAAAIEA